MFVDFLNSGFGPSGWVVNMVCMSVPGSSQLEGRWVEPADGKHSWQYVIGDESPYVAYEAHTGWDGCLNLYAYSNGYQPGMLPVEDDNIDYLHVCHVDEFVAMLMDLRARNPKVTA